MGMRLGGGGGVLGNIASKFLIGPFQFYISMVIKPKNNYLYKTALTHRLLHVKLMTGPLSLKSILDVILLKLARLQLSL